VLATFRYAARSYLDRVPKVPWDAIMAQVVGLFVCGAMHLALLGMATSVMSGDMPEDAARSWSAWVAIVGTVLIVAAFALSVARGGTKQTELSETVRGRVSNLWPSLLAIQCAYTTGASVVLRHGQGTRWSEVPAVSLLILLALVVTFCILLSLLQWLLGIAARHIDQRMKGTPTGLGCALAQPHFTVVAWVNDYFAAWPVVASVAMAASIATGFTDTSNLRNPSEWRNMVLFIQYSAVGAFVTASAWQYWQPPY
jgi:hypothetical protein